MLPVSEELSAGTRGVAGVPGPGEPVELELRVDVGQRFIPRGRPVANCVSKRRGYVGSIDEFTHPSVEPEGRAHVGQEPRSKLLGGSLAQRDDCVGGEVTAELMTRAGSARLLGAGGGCPSSTPTSRVVSSSLEPLLATPSMRANPISSSVRHGRENH